MFKLRVRKHTSRPHARGVFNYKRLRSKYPVRLSKLRDYKPLLPAGHVKSLPDSVVPSRLPPQVVGPGITLQRAKRITRTWGHATGKSLPTTVYQLLNCHWPTKNAFNLPQLKDFIQQIKRLDGGTQPLFLAVRAMEGLSFCPGADLICLLRHDVEYRKEFFRTAYQACYITATTKTPLMMCMQGAVMGLGAGLTMHAPLFRIAFPDSVWAMPNTMYGAFPDCGSTWVLPRLRGEVGLYLGLTGKRLEGSDIVDVGIASHTMTVDSFDDMNRMSGKIFDLFDLFDVFDHVKRYVPVQSAILKVLPAINRCFGKDTLEEIFVALNEEVEHKQWAQNILKRLQSCSPLMLHVTFRQLKIGKYITTPEEAFHLEYRIARRMASSHDFEEGIRARLIEKREPKWQHKDIYSVKNEDIAQFFNSDDDPTDILHLEPCQPGFRPATDPYSAYDFELVPHLKQYPLSQLLAERVISTIEPKHVNTTTLHEFYRDLFKEGGMDKEAAQGFAVRYGKIDRAAIRILRQFTELNTITPAVGEIIEMKQKARDINRFHRYSPWIEDEEAVELYKESQLPLTVGPQEEHSTGGFKL